MARYPQLLPTINQKGNFFFFFNPVVTSGTDIPMGLIFGIINILYPIIISVIAIVMTTLDKKYAEKGGWRISERSLFLVAILGGALAMYITMKIIRHKTQHKRFMIGLPIIIALHILLIVGIPVIILLSTFLQLNY